MGRNALVIGGVVVVGAVVALVLALRGDERRAGSPAATSSVTSQPPAGTIVPAAGQGAPGGASATSEPGRAASGDPAAGQAGNGPRPLPPGPPQVASPDDPRAPIVTESRIARADRDDQAADSSYTVGKLAVRDHRGSGAPRVDVPISAHPPGEQLIDPSLTSEVGQKVRAVIYACARGASREGAGPEPKVVGQFVIDVVAH
jgi:hypothetical protein